MLNILFPGFLAIALCGCATRNQFMGARKFDFEKDTFAYSNELVWEYHFDAGGKWVHENREPKLDYSHHCFVVARSARQFFQNATFAPNLPAVDDQTYRKLIRRVVAVDPARALPPDKKIVISGYANLREFSRAKESLLKAECGGTWHSYVQRGHWRMIFPLSRAQQARMAGRLLADLEQGRPPVVHVVRFPQLTINHAMLVFEAKESANEIDFSVYDPNNADRPATLKFDRASRTFSLPANNYFPCGRVDVYEVYRSWDY